MVAGRPQSMVASRPQSNPQKVYLFLRTQTPEAFCDDCIAAGAEIQRREAVNPITEALSLTTDFDIKGRGICSMCKNDVKLVTRSLRYGNRRRS
jgi:hypothetical protein